MFVNIRVLMAMCCLNHLVALTIGAQRLTALEILSPIKVEFIHGIFISGSMPVLCSFMLTMIMLALVSQESMTVRISPVKDFVHHNVDDQASTCGNKHHKWSLNVLTGNDPFWSFKDDEKEQHIYDEEIGESSEKFHSMVAEGHLRSGFLFWEIEEEKAEDEAHQVSDEMDGIRNDGDGVRDDSSCDFTAYEDKGDQNNNNQPFVTIGIVLFWRRFVEVLLISFRLGPFCLHPLTFRF
jgi:hypothetical protein